MAITGDGRFGREQLHEELTRVIKNMELMCEGTGTTQGRYVPDANQALRLFKEARSRLTGDYHIDDMIGRCVTTMATKGAEYTVGSSDRLANFRGVAADVGIPMEKAWYVFFNKHLRAVQSYIRNGCKVKSEEKISGRIMDCVVYLLLFYLLTIENEPCPAASDSVLQRKLTDADRDEPDCYALS